MLVKRLNQIKVAQNRHGHAMQDAEAAAAALEQRCGELRATQAAVQVEVDALSDAKVQACLILYVFKSAKDMRSALCHCMSSPRLGQTCLFRCVASVRRRCLPLLHCSERRGYLRTPRPGAVTRAHSRLNRCCHNEPSYACHQHAVSVV